MSDAASGAGVLSGQGGDPSPQAEQPTGNAPETPWYGNQELSGYIENKGWSQPQQVVEGYQNLEKILGDKANAIVMPKEGDEQGWGALYDKLGRPPTAEGYKFEVPEGGDENLTNWFRETAHKTGLTQAQAEAVFNEWNQFAQNGNEEAQAQIAQKAEADITSLKKDWGQEYDANIRAGQQAASRFGFSEEEISGMESVLGTRALLEKFAKIGRAFGEDSFESGTGGRNSFGLTPSAAQQQIAELKGDQTFTAAYLDPAHSGHKAAVDKMNRLMQAAHGGA